MFGQFQLAKFTPHMFEKLTKIDFFVALTGKSLLTNLFNQLSINFRLSYSEITQKSFFPKQSTLQMIATAQKLLYFSLYIDLPGF